MKKLFSLLLILPLLFYCTPENNNKNNNAAETDTEADDVYNPNEAIPVDQLPAEIHSGDVLQATNPNVQKFLDEVTYVDKDYKTTHVIEYYGGYNAVDPIPEGGFNSDIPCSYTIRWESNPNGNQLRYVLTESEDDWSINRKVHPGWGYIVVTNLVPKTTYTYSLTDTKTKEVVAEGTFTTTGSLHQVFFEPKGRNARDLGGWITTDGKQVRYHKIYRGGRFQTGEVSTQGKKDAYREGIRAQLDLRGKSDVLAKPALKTFDFCAPIIEQGGMTMLYDVNSETGKNRTAQCFEFIVNSLRENKPVYFHCSLGRDRTGTLGILLLGLLGVPQHDIAKEYELTYFAPYGWSVSQGEQSGTEDTWVFRNTLDKWVFSDVAPYFWSMAPKTENATFADGVENYLKTVAGVSQEDIDDFRRIMLKDVAE